MSHPFSVRISGQWRRAQDNFASLKNLCRQASTVHVATWSVDNNGAPVTQDHIEHVLGVRLSSCSIFVDDPEYSDQIAGKVFPTNHPAHPKHRKNVLRSFFLRFMVKNSDLSTAQTVLHLRPDASVIPNLELFPSEILHSCSFQLNPRTQVSDKAAFGSREVMNKYADVWNDLEMYISRLTGEGTSEIIMKMAFPQGKYVKILSDASMTGMTAVQLCRVFQCAETH